MSANMEENPMRGTLTDEEIAARNVIPTTNPAGEPHRIIADEHFSENDTFTQWVPTDPDQPGPGRVRAAQAHRALRGAEDL